MNPLFKWVGGKRKYLPQIKSLMPPAYGTYHEVFAGGAALYFDLEPRLAMLSDASMHNVNFFKAVGVACADLIDRVGTVAGNYNQAGKGERRRQFEGLRTSYNERNAAGWQIIHVGQATGFYGALYAGYNGLWRLNRKGELNTPFGDGVGEIPCDAAAFWQAHKLLSRTVIRRLDFAKAMKDAAAGDFVFADPPYMDQFDGYTGNKFGVAEHYKLYLAVEDARKRGAAVMVTTNDHGYIRGLYSKKHYRIAEMPRMQTISCKGGERGATGDIVIMGY